MSVLKLKGKGLFIESFRTPAERKRAEMDKKTEEVIKENTELKERLARLEKLVGVDTEKDGDK